MEKNDWNLPQELRRLRIHRMMAVIVTFISVTLSLTGAHLVLLNEKIVRFEEEVEFVESAYFLTEESTLETEALDPKFLSQEKDVISTDEAFNYYDVPLSFQLQEYTQELCEEMGVHYPLVLAIMAQESGFNPSAISPANNNGSRDFGLMQINSRNHQWLESVLDVSDWLDPRQSILAGIYILSLYDDWQEDYQTIAMLYNTGPTGGKSYLESGTFSEYSYQVMGKLEEIQSTTKERECIS